MRIEFGTVADQTYTLVVGRNPATRGPLVQSVRDTDQPVITTSNVHEAIEELRRYGKKITSALIEVADKDFLNLTKRLSKHIPVLALSPFNNREAVDLLERAGADYIVTLPFSKEQLDREVALIIHQADSTIAH